MASRDRRAYRQLVTWHAQGGIRAGRYEGYPPAGADLRFPVIALPYTYDSEEVGASAGQDRDRRLILTLNIGRQRCRCGSRKGTLNRACLFVFPFPMSIRHEVIPAT